MIDIAPTTAFLLYLGSLLSALFGLWVYRNFKQRNKNPLPSPSHLFVCEFCHYAYLEEKSKAVTQCPQCNSHNKHNPYQKK